MIRYFLARGDRAGGAVIIDGLPYVTCANPPPSVEIATLYMTTWCAVCGREGFIAPVGPRWPGTAPNGQPWALSGDINVCGCNPPPVFHAERGMKMIFTEEEVAQLVGGTALSAGVPRPDRYDEQFLLTDGNGNPLAHTWYTAELPSGERFHGETDSEGRTRRHATDNARKVVIYIGHRQED